MTLHFPSEPNYYVNGEPVFVSRCGFRLREVPAGGIYAHDKYGHFLGLFFSRQSAIARCKQVATRTPKPKPPKKLHIKHGDLVAKTADNA